jgi:hypothetical protein
VQRRAIPCNLMRPRAIPCNLKQSRATKIPTKNVLPIVDYGLWSTRVRVYPTVQDQHVLVARIMDSPMELATDDQVDFLSLKHLWCVVYKSPHNLIKLARTK